MLPKETSCEALRFHSFIRHMECRLLLKNINIMTPTRTASCQRTDRTAIGHSVTVTYTSILQI